VRNKGESKKKKKNTEEGRGKFACSNRHVAIGGGRVGLTGGEKTAGTRSVPRQGSEASDELRGGEINYKRKNYSSWGVFSEGFEGGKKKLHITTKTLQLLTVP